MPKLEEEAKSVRELRKIAELLDTGIAACMEEIKGNRTETLDFHGDLDAQIAEQNYITVEQCVVTLRELSDTETIDGPVDAGLIRLGRYLG